tara:strand:+ start:1936 stop:2172 length:237 start_codon:yes stop_codon:yes gene_type:complete
MTIPSLTQANAAGPATATGGTLGNIDINIGGGVVSELSKAWRKSPWAVLAVVGLIAGFGLMLVSGGGHRKPGKSRKKR